MDCLCTEAVSLGLLRNELAQRAHNAPGFVEFVRMAQHMLLKLLVQAAGPHSRPVSPTLHYFW